MVLALFRDPDPQVATLCEQLDLDPQTIIDAVEARMTTGPVGPITGQLPFSEEAKNALLASMTLASSLSHSWICRFHLLLGLIDNGKGEEAEALGRLGVNPDQVMKAVACIEPPISSEAESLRERLLVWVRAVEAKGPYSYKVLEDSGENLIILLIATDALWLLEVRDSDFVRSQVFDLGRTSEGEGVWSDLDELFGGIPDSE